MGETERIDSRFLEPACGNGDFLAQVPQRDFPLDTITLPSSFRAEDSLFANFEKHGIFTLAKTSPPA